MKHSASKGKNKSNAPVEIGALGIPLIFNNNAGHDGDQGRVQAMSAFSDPAIGLDGGYVQVTRLNGHGPALVVVPQGRTPLEACLPLQSDKIGDRTPITQTFEAFYEWMVQSRACRGQNGGLDGLPIPAGKPPFDDEAAQPSRDVVRCGGVRVVVPFQTDYGAVIEFDIKLRGGANATRNKKRSQGKREERPFHGRMSIYEIDHLGQLAASARRVRMP